MLTKENTTKSYLNISEKCARQYSYRNEFVRKPNDFQMVWHRIKKTKRKWHDTHTTIAQRLPVWIDFFPQTHIHIDSFFFCSIHPCRQIQANRWLRWRTGFSTLRSHSHISLLVFCIFTPIYINMFHIQNVANMLSSFFLAIALPSFLSSLWCVFFYLFFFLLSFSLCVWKHYPLFPIKEIPYKIYRLPPVKWLTVSFSRSPPTL